MYVLLVTVAIATAATTTAIATKIPAATATTAFAGHHGTRFIYHQCAALQLAAIACFHRMIGLAIVMNFNKAKSAGFSAKTVPHHIHAVDGYAGLFKKRLYIGFYRGIRQIPNEKFHCTLLNDY